MFFPTLSITGESKSIEITKGLLLLMRSRQSSGSCKKSFTNTNYLSSGADTTLLGVTLSPSCMSTLSTLSPT